MDKYGLACFLLGLGIGVGLGLLFAPAPGAEMRGRIKGKTEEGADYLKRQAGAVRDTASDMVEKGKDAARRTKGAVTDTASAAQNAVYEG